MKPDQLEKDKLYQYQLYGKSYTMRYTGTNKPVKDLNAWFFEVVSAKKPYTTFIFESEMKDLHLCCKT